MRRWAIASALAIVPAFAPSSARANLVVSAGHGTVQFSEQTYVPASIELLNPVFQTITIGGDQVTQLLSPGQGYSPIASGFTGETQVISGSISPTSLVATANPNQIGNLTFGSASTQIVTIAPATNVSRGSITGGGLFFFPVSVADTVSDSLASVSTSFATVTFTNPAGSLAASGIPGLVLSLKGTLSSPTNDYAAVGLTGDITVTGPGITDPITRSFNPVVMGTDGNGTGRDFASGGTTSTFSLAANGLSFTAFAISNLSSSITLQPGQSATLRATLTLIGDPSSIDAGDFDPNDPNLPDFGVIAAAAIPEPSSIVMLSSGLAAVGLLAWRRSRRTPCGDSQKS